MISVTASLQTRNGIYQAVLSYKINGKWATKWKSTKIKDVKGNKKKAEAKKEEIRQNFENEINTKQKCTDNKNSLLFIDYIKNWLKIVKPTIEPNTYGSYKQMVNYRITKYFSKNKIKLEELQPIDIQKFYTTMLNDGLSSNTVVHYHAIIHKSLDYAFKMDMIKSNIADKVKKPKIEQFIGDFYNESELNILFKKSKGDPLELIIFLAAFYGLRRSEVAGLKWDAIDFKNNTITIKHTIVQVSTKGERKILGKDRTKNKSSYRTLPLVPEVVELLKKFKQVQDNNKNLCGKNYNLEYKDYICVDSVGNIINPDFITKHFKKLLEKNNLRIIRFHDLRHSCASLLLSRGISLKEIQEWLGHSNFNTTANIYAHLDTKIKQNSANVLSSIFNTKKNIPALESR